jgi:glycosyltransferase involved in cell wall biosynthesis
MGVVGANLLAHCPRVGLEAAYFPVGPVEASPRHADAVREARARAASFDPLAPSVRYWHPDDLAHHVGKGLRAGYTIFEVDRLSAAARHHLSSQDLVLVPTAWAARVVEANGIPAGRIRVVPHGVDASVFYPLPLSPDGPTTFLNVGKWEIRKGHDALAEAFNAAFTPADDVKLVMHCDNPFLDDGGNREWADLYLNSPLGKAGKITVSPGRYRTQEELAGLYASAHCGVFPSRAEGWNNGLVEMLAMGRHAVATDYSAHTEFLTPECCRLIGIDSLERAYDGRWFKGEGNWARLGPPQMEQLVWHLRSVHKQRREGALGLNRAGADRTAAFGWVRACERLRAAIT